MFALTKFLSLWIYPLGISTLLACVALVLLLRRHRLAALWSLGLAIVNLWVFSTAAVADALVHWLEKDWLDRPVSALPSADAVIVLGGAFSSGNGQFVYPDAGGHVDRYWHAARIYHAGKAPLIIVSGGRSPHLAAGPTEAEMGAQFLADLGVPPGAIIEDRASLDTHDHAVQLERISVDYGLERVMVVTSARHMRRALATLRDAGPELVPAATDFTVSQDPPATIRRYLPGVSALSRSTSALHEIYGMVYYRVMGWM
ncbi:MAG: YdcF family protein [Xanthomonadales bacterium]|jgi:uncharacterized SAM-binding protein YcdF (DUF218 family)|nr:YdcF family protein [Xanthomonadales bacterium]